MYKRRKIGRINKVLSKCKNTNAFEELKTQVKLQNPILSVALESVDFKDKLAMQFII